LFRLLYPFIIDIWGLGGPEEDHELHHCCWTGRVGEREEEEDHRHVNGSEELKVF